MKLQPRNNRVLISAVGLRDSKLITTEGHAPVTHWHVHAVAPDAEHICKPGDDVLLRPDPNILQLRSAEGAPQFLGMVDASCVFAVLTGTDVPEVEV